MKEKKIEDKGEMGNDRKNGGAKTKTKIGLEKRRAKKALGKETCMMHHEVDCS